MISRSSWLKIGVGGTVFTAICCFTPLLVVLLSVIGLSALTAYLDFILLPLLAFFILVTLVSLWKKIET